MEQLCFEPTTAAQVRTAIDEENERLRDHLDTYDLELNATLGEEDPVAMARRGGFRELVSFATRYRCRVRVISADGSVQVHDPVTVTTQDTLPVVSMIYTGGHYQAAVRSTVGKCTKKKKKSRYLFLY